MQPVGVLLSLSARGWLSTRGVWLAFAAGLVPLLLTGAWVLTHQADVAATGLVSDKGTLDEFGRLTVTEGERVTFTGTVQNVGRSATGPFNASLVVLSYGLRLEPDGSVGVDLARAQQEDERRETIPGLGPGETASVRLSWNATVRAGTVPGLYLAALIADADGDVSEIEELNNFAHLGGTRGKIEPFLVDFRPPGPEGAPDPPPGLDGNASRGLETDARIDGLTLDQRSWTLGQEVRARAVVANGGPGLLENATVTLRFGRVSFGTALTTLHSTTQTVTVASGGFAAVNGSWIPQDQLGSFWVQASVAPALSADPDTLNNVRAEGFSVKAIVHPSLVELANQHPALKPFLEAQERGTIKSFYSAIFGFLHLHIIIPLIGLFYAGGVISDERERGNLTYLLVRPVRRWLVPLSKFAAGFAVAAAAIVFGVAASFGVMFGAPGGDIGFLTTPIFISLVALLAYGAFFTLLGVHVDRPYLVGLAFVIGWEGIAGNLVPWAGNLTINRHVVNAFQGWKLDAGVQTLPAAGEATTALQILLAATVAFLALAAYSMTRREFPE